MIGGMLREQYRRLKELGNGSFGTVYLVQHRHDKAVFHVAKTIKLTHLSDKERELALQEASYLQKVSHPNVISYVTCFLEEKRLHIIMEYADKGDLGQKIRRRRDDNRTFSESGVMRYIVQLALALQHIHGHNILHRDVKPTNIFLTGHDEEVKLGDFGVARIIDSFTHGAETQIGTPHYLPPEVINMEKYGTSSELWSLGVVMYELMTLHVPFNAPSLPGIAMQICGADPAPLPTQYSNPLRRTTLDLLDKVPGQRPTLTEVLRGPRSENDLWAVAVRRQRDKLTAIVEGRGVARQDQSSDAHAGRGRERRLREEYSQKSKVPIKDAHFRALEIARLEALEDRRMAKQRALSHRSSVDDGSSQAPPSSARSVRSNSVVAAGGGLGAKADDARLQALARASCQAAEQRSARLAQCSSITVSEQRPQSACTSSAISMHKHQDSCQAPWTALSRATSEASEERKRIKAKFEHCPPAWMHDMSHRHRLVA